MVGKKTMFAVTCTITLVMVGLIYWIGLGDHPTFMKVGLGGVMLAALFAFMAYDLNQLKEDTSL